MKSAFLILALASGAIASTPVLVRPDAAAITRLQQSSPMSTLVAPAATAPSRPAAPSIIRKSMVLHDGKNWTIVPKGAVIFLPEAVQHRVNVKPVGNLLPWADFLAKNSTWIATDEVTFDQAAGNDSLPAGQAAAWTKQDKLVVAVHHRGPISVQIGKELPAVTQR